MARAGRLINISSNSFVPAGGFSTVGFVIGGSLPRTVLLRAVGPSLATFGVPNPVADPRLQLFNSGGASIATNDDWQVQANPVAISTAASQVGAFVLPIGSKDAALLMTLNPGNYTFQAKSAEGSAGSVLLEAYEMPTP
jgi:hypothetical protein